MTKGSEHHADSHDYGQHHTDDVNLHPFVPDMYLYGDPGMQPAAQRSRQIRCAWLVQITSKTQKRITSGKRLSGVCVHCLPAIVIPNKLKTICHQGSGVTVSSRNDQHDQDLTWQVENCPRGWLNTKNEVCWTSLPSSHPA